VGGHSVDELAHRLTSRQGLSGSGVRFPDLGPPVLDAAATGDEVAEAIVARHVRLVASYVRAAARQVGLEPPYEVTVGGGTIRHAGGALLAGLVEALDGEVTVTHCRREPVVGALVKAMRAAGHCVDDAVLARLEETTPATAFFATLASLASLRSDVTLD